MGVWRRSPRSLQKGSIMLRSRIVLCAFALVSTLATGCGPSDEDRVLARERFALQAQEFAVLQASGTSCDAVRQNTDAWYAEHADAVEASELWWDDLSEGTQETLYEEEGDALPDGMWDGVIAATIQCHGFNFGSRR